MNGLSYIFRSLIAGSYTLANIVALYAHEKVTGNNVFYSYAKHWAQTILRCAGVKLLVLVDPGQAVPDSCIYVCNHLSLLDAPSLIAALPQGVRFMYKQEIERVPIFGGTLARSPYIAVNRNSPREAAASFYRAVKDISGGGATLLFPEGTWSPDGTLLPFKRGALLMALRVGKPIVPLAIWGTQFALPPEKYRFFGGTAVVCIGEPIYPPDITTAASEQTIAESIRQKIEILIEKCRQEWE